MRPNLLNEGHTLFDLNAEIIDELLDVWYGSRLNSLLTAHCVMPET